MDGRHTLAKDYGECELPPRENIRNCWTANRFDCIVAAVPDHWHRRVVVDACNAGKDIYCEKPMSHNHDGFAMVDALAEEQLHRGRSE